jgi:hypothetical protein
MPDIVIQIGMCLDAYDQQLGGNARKFFVDQVAKLISQAAKDVNNNSPLYAGISPEIPVVNSICFDNTERLGVTLVNNIGLRDANGHTPFDHLGCVHLPEGKFGVHDRVRAWRNAETLVSGLRTRRDSNESQVFNARFLHKGTSAGAPQLRLACFNVATSLRRRDWN